MKFVIEGSMGIRKLLRGIKGIGKTRSKIKTNADQKKFLGKAKTHKHKIEYKMNDILSRAKNPTQHDPHNDQHLDHNKAARLKMGSPEKRIKSDPEHKLNQFKLRHDLRQGKINRDKKKKGTFNPNNN